jgi:hypothetical protein
MVARRTFVAAASGLVVFSGARAHAADEAGKCAAASNQAQDLRSANKLRAAREQLVTCVRDVCPAMVRNDCAQWIGEVEQAMPTIVLSATDASGKDLVAVRVTMDGEVLATTLGGTALNVDPGPHTMHYETAGSPPVDEKVVFRVGEKNRAVKVQFGGGAPPSGTAQGAAPPPLAPEAPSSGKHVPTASIVLGAVGVVALGSFIAFGVTGKNDADNLRSTCAPNCAQSDVDSVKTKLHLADASLGVGVVALAVAAYLWATSDSGAPAAPATGLDVRPSPGGGVVTFGSSF